MIVLHLLPGALAMVLMLIAGYWLKRGGLTTKRANYIFLYCPSIDDHVAWLLVLQRQAIERKVFLAGHCALSG